MGELLQVSKFQLSSSSELIGSVKPFNELRKAIRNNEKIVLHGPPGCGKTSSVHVIAKELGIRVYETNASDKRKSLDLKYILSLSKHTGIFGEKFLILLDEADGVKSKKKEKAGIESWDIVEKILKDSPHSIVLTANDEWRIPKKIKSCCKVIRLYYPYVNDVLERMKKLAGNRKVDYSGVTRDVRSSIGATFYGGEAYKTKDVFEVVKKFFIDNNLDGITKDEIPFLIDNAPQFYYGVRLYNFYRILEIAVRTRLSILKGFPMGAGSKVTYPYYLRKSKFYRKKKE